MTKLNETTKTNKTDKKDSNEKYTHTTIGMTAEDIMVVKDWYLGARVTECKTALVKWIKIGEICSRIKQLKSGKFSENCIEIIGISMIDDERQYSMKLYEERGFITEWYNKSGCMKYNPRTIYTAWKNSLKPVLTAEEKKEVKEKKAEEKVLRSERHGVDAIKAFAEYRLIRDKASEDGNVVLEDLETLKKELEDELKAICEAIQLEAPVVEVKKGKGKGKGKGSLKKAA